MWNTPIKDKIERKTKIIDRNVIILTSNSGQYENAKNNWMPGRTLSIIVSKQSFLITKYKSNSKGRQNMVFIEAKGKKIAIITVYCLSDSNTNGICTVKAQLDKAAK